MNQLLEDFRIPTLLALPILVLGLSAGVYLTARNQILNTRAAPQVTAKNITVTNIEEDSTAISWQTDTKASGFVTFGLDSTQGQTALDDRDKTVPIPRIIHHVTLLNLSPQTTYQFRVFSGKFSSDTLQFTTASSAPQNGLKPIIGSVLDGDEPLDEGVVYLQIDGALTQSAPVKDLGNFVIPLSGLRSSDLRSILTPAAGSMAKLKVLAPNQQSASASFTIQDSSDPIGPLITGQDLDLTQNHLGASTSKYDLNDDGVVNSSDYSMVLKNFGNLPAGGSKEKKADLNSDGVVDKTDLSLIIKEFSHH